MNWDTFLNKALPTITVFLTSLLGLWKYLEQRKLEHSSRRYEQFHKLMLRIAAWSEETEETKLPVTEQIASIYELESIRKLRQGLA